MSGKKTRVLPDEDLVEMAKQLKGARVDNKTTGAGRDSAPMGARLSSRD